jgi:hypothetical protein
MRFIGLVLAGTSTAVVLPFLLIFVALGAAAAVAFGTHPGWAHLEQGLAVILWSRRLQWLLVAVAIVACVGLISVSVSRKRGLWLVGLIPVLGLFAHRFAAENGDNGFVVEDPLFVEVDKAQFVRDDDWVVGLRLGDKWFAYPFAALYLEPTVVQSEHDKRLALFWNAQANRVLAFQATPEFRGRDLDIVSTPANSILVYNARFGQFICGVTGLTPDRRKPTGLGAAIATTKTTYARWKAVHPEGLVMKPSARAASLAVPAPTFPIWPDYDRTKPLSTAPAEARANGTQGMTPLAATTSAGTPPPLVPATRRRVAIVGSMQPLAVDAASLSLKPNFAKADDQSVVLLRTDMNGISFRAFSRKLDDMTLRLEPKKDAKLSDVRMTDLETGSLWSSAGVAVGGTPQFRGRRLASLPVDEDVDYESMKYWLPELDVYAEPAPPPTIRTSSAPNDANKTPKKPAVKRSTAATPRTPKPTRR